MKILYKTTALAALLGFVSVGARAESFLEALSYAYEANPTLAAHRVYLKAVDETVTQAKTGYRPQVYVQGTVARGYQELESDKLFGLAGGKSKIHDTPSSVSAQVVQPIFSGFSTVSQVKTAQNNVLAERSNLIATEQSVLQAVAVAYVNIVQAEAVLVLQKNNEHVLERHLQSTKDKFKFGEVTKTDVAQSEARLAGAKSARIKAQGDLQIAKAQYQNIVGRAAGKLDNKINLNHLLPSSLQESIELALSSNPLIQQAKYQETAARYAVNTAKSDLMPSLNVTAEAGKQWNQLTGYDEVDFWQVGASLKVPLFQGGGDYAKIRAQKQLANRSRIALEKVKIDVIEQATQSWEQWQTAKAEILSIQSQIEASKSALDGVQREAEVGARTVLDVLDATQEYLDTQVSLVRANSDELIAQVHLLSAVGKMTAQNLSLDVETYNPNSYYDDVQGKWFGTGIE
jgi:outer membrane protein